MPLTIPEGGRSIFAGRIEEDDDEEEVVVVTSGGAEKFSGGVQASAGDWTNVDRLLVGMGRAIFCSLCFASAA